MAEEHVLVYEPPPRDTSFRISNTHPYQSDETVIQHPPLPTSTQSDHLDAEKSLIDSLYSAEKDLDRLEAKTVQAFDRNSSYRVFIETELSSLRDTLQQLHATITSLCSQSSSNPPSQPATPPSTLNLCVESSPSDSPITISHLSRDLLEVEATLESLQSTLSGTLWSCVPLDEHFSLLRDTLATLHSQTTTITQSIQRVTQILTPLIQPVSPVTRDLTATVAIVQETEPLVELLPLLTRRLDDVAKLLRREGVMEQELKELQRRQETVETLLQSNHSLVEEVGTRCGCDVVEGADAEGDSGDEGASRLPVVKLVG
ncbi:hypothetical protein WA538_000685, partial [Blastocystis sp. DL]